MKIPTVESRASNISMDKGDYIYCHNGSTDKDLCRICRSQYGHPGSAIGYWPERCLGHVYIVLEPVGSARLNVRWRYNTMSYVCWWPNVVRSFGWDHEYDEELRNGPEVKIDMWIVVFDLRKGSGCFPKCLGTRTLYLGQRGKPTRFLESAKGSFAESRGQTLGSLASGSRRREP